jgi:hypothetical protein
MAIYCGQPMNDKDLTMNAKEKIGTLTQAIHQHSAPAADKYIKQVEEMILAQAAEIESLKAFCFQMLPVYKEKRDYSKGKIIERYLLRDIDDAAIDAAEKDGVE